MTPPRGCATAVADPHPIGRTTASAGVLRTPAGPRIRVSLGPHENSQPFLDDDDERRRCLRFLVPDKSQPRRPELGHNEHHPKWPWLGELRWPTQSQLQPPYWPHSTTRAEPVRFCYIATSIPFRSIVDFNYPACISPPCPLFNYLSSPGLQLPPDGSRSGLFIAPLFLRFSLSVASSTSPDFPQISNLAIRSSHTMSWKGFQKGVVRVSLLSNIKPFINLRKSNGDHRPLKP